MGYHVSREDAQSGGSRQPGRYLVEVTAATLKTSNKGDKMLSLDIKNVETGRRLLFDNVMLSGNGAGIGVKKAQAFDLALEHEDGSWEIASALSWIGARAYVHAIPKKDDPRYLEADFGATEWFGYEPLEGVTQPEPAKAAATTGARQPESDGGLPDADDIPF